MSQPSLVQSLTLPLGYILILSFRFPMSSKWSPPLRLSDQNSLFISKVKYFIAYNQVDLNTQVFLQGAYSVGPCPLQGQSHNPGLFTRHSCPLWPIVAVSPLICSPILVTPVISPFWLHDVNRGHCRTWGFTVVSSRLHGATNGRRYSPWNFCVLQEFFSTSGKPESFSARGCMDWRNSLTTQSRVRRLLTRNCKSAWRTTVFRIVYFRR